MYFFTLTAWKAHLQSFKTSRGSNLGPELYIFDKIFEFFLMTKSLEGTGIFIWESFRLHLNGKYLRNKSIPEQTYMGTNIISQYPILGSWLLMKISSDDQGKWIIGSYSWSENDLLLKALSHEHYSFISRVQKSVE